MHLTIINTEKELFNGDAQLVQFPGTEGSFEVLPGHAKMIATLGPGDIRIVKNQQETVMVNVSGGVVEIRDDNILVLAR